MKISIIIPVYNKRKYLETLFRQIKEQTFTDYECLLIDDGSSDGSEAICDQIAQEDERFRVFHIPNGGVSNARNIGLDYAQGEYITFIDSDDEILPNYIGNLYQCAANSEADMVISGCLKFWDDCDKTISVFHPELSGKMLFSHCLNTFCRIQKNTGLFGCCVSKIFKASLLNDVRFDRDLRLAEDFDFYLRLYAKIKTVYFDNQCLYRYRQEADNSSVKVDDAKIDYVSQLRVNLKYREFLRRFAVYSGENRDILEQTLSNYLYFSAFHCPKASMKARLPELSDIQRCEQIKFISGNKLQRSVLALLGKGHWRLTKILLTVYRCLRNIIRR